MLSRVFRAFHYREFRLLWAGACVSSIGTWMQQLAQSWLVYKISGSSFYLGLDAFLGQIPIFLFSLIGGAIADRVDRRFILLASQVVQMTCAFTLAALFTFTQVHVWEILILSFIVGFAQAFGGPAYQALIPNLVEAKDVPNAIALNSIQFNLARVIGPVLGGIALQKLGAAWCFGLNGVSFLAVIASLLTLQPRKLAASGVNMLGSIKEGIGFVRGRAGMGALIVLAFLMTLLGIPIMVFLPVFAKDVFHGSSTLFTMFLCDFGAGAVAGALAVAGLGEMRNRGRVALMILVCLGVIIACFASSRSVVFSGVMLFLAGGALTAMFSLVTSLVQLLTANEMRGRVMSVYNVAFRGGMPIGSLLAGRLIEHFSAPPVIAFNGILLVVLGIYFLLNRRVASL